MQVTLNDSTGRISGMMGFWSWFAVIISCIGLIYLYKTTATDPGTIPVGCATDTRRVNGSRIDEDRRNVHQCVTIACSVFQMMLDRNLDSPVLWSGNWSQLCVTCKIVRPLRAKHCAVTNRCIEVILHWFAFELPDPDSSYRCLIIIVLGLAMQLERAIDTISLSFYG